MDLVTTWVFSSTLWTLDSLWVSYKDEWLKPTYHKSPWFCESDSLKSGKNEFQRDGKIAVVQLKIVPTIFHGICHVLDLLRCDTCLYPFYDIIYNKKLDSIDIPKSFNIYFTERNSWQVAWKELWKFMILKEKLNRLSHLNEHIVGFF